MENPGRGGERRGNLTPYSGTTPYVTLRKAWSLRAGKYPPMRGEQGRYGIQAARADLDDMRRRRRSLATVMLLVSFVVAGLRIELLVLALSRSGRAGKIAA
jgi:hypothetical protein